MKEIFDPYVLWPFGKKLIYKLVTHVRTRDYVVCDILEILDTRQSQKKLGLG